MTLAAAAVLLMAPRAPSGELDALLGPERGAELLGLLAAQTERWAREVAPGAVHRAGDGEPLSEAVGRAFTVDQGALLVVWPLLPQLRPEHASGALDDLGSGADVVLGPIIDGGLYLLGLRRPVPELLAFPEERWQDPDVMTLGFAAARDADLEVGILRAERALRSAADARAALADPLLPSRIRSILDRRTPATPRNSA